MLKLARRQDESLVVITPAGEHIKILIMDAFDGFTRLGIEAPSEYQILKAEFLTRDKVA